MQCVSHLVSLCLIFACSYFPYTIERLRAKQGLSGLCCPFSSVAMKQNSILIQASYLSLNADCTSEIIHTFTRIVFLRRCMSDLIWFSSQCSGLGFGLGLVMVGGGWEEPYILKCRLWESCSQHLHVSLCFFSFGYCLISCSR